MTNVRPRGRPRSEETRLSILKAAGDLLLRSGIQGFTIEAVADLSGASKVTIYKWWPSKGALAMDGFFASVSPTIDVTSTGNCEADLATQAEAIVRLFRDTSVGPVLAGLIGEAQKDPEPGERPADSMGLDPRREVGALNSSGLENRRVPCVMISTQRSFSIRLWGNLYPTGALVTCQCRTAWRPRWFCYIMVGIASLPPRRKSGRANAGKQRR